MHTLTRLLLILILTGQAAAIPQLINYQGQLERPDGTPLDTTVAMIFRLYGASGGGSAIWTETRPSVTVTDGLFQVALGSVTTLPDSFAVNRWLGVTVGSNSEMTPRQQVVSVAHAYRVGTVDGASGGTISGKLNVGTANTNAGTSAIVLGINNHARGDNSVISGGGEAGNDSNSATGAWSTISGGRGNFASGSHAAIGGGGENVASNFYSSVWGGLRNEALGSYSAICGGSDNSTGLTSGTYAFIGGGRFNEATGFWSTVLGGYDNTVSGDYSAILAGSNNNVSGWRSYSLGSDLTTTGSHSIVCGTNASASADSCFVWSDGSGPLFSIGAGNTFNVKANGGVRFWTTADHAANIGTRLAAGGSSWIALSDSAMKTNRVPVNTSIVLQKVSALPLDQWNYKHQADGPLHMGPMAQDLWTAFHLGEDSLGIETIDADGILFAAIQELSKQNNKQHTTIEKQQSEINELRALVQSLVAEKQQTTVTTKK